MYITVYMHRIYVCKYEKVRRGGKMTKTSDDNDAIWPTRTAVANNNGVRAVEQLVIPKDQGISCTAKKLLNDEERVSPLKTTYH